MPNMSLQVALKALHTCDHDMTRTRGREKEKVEQNAAMTHRIT